MTGWRLRARGLADTLAAGGVLDPSWRAAFEQVPRHVFVPRFYRDNDVIVDGTDPRQREVWLDTVYRDESLTTQLMAVPGTDLRWPTSSSTKPSLMARMLSMLDVVDRHTVLEIGTGTGYNAALLAYRLGAHPITSIDIDRALVGAAAAALKEFDFAPHLVVGDGEIGVPERAPFDRVIATCAVPSIPGPWVAQLADRGLIVADVRAETSSTLVAARKISDDTVCGRFRAMPGHFMWLRPRANDPLRNEAQGDFVFDLRDARHSVSELDPKLLRDADFGFVLACHVRDIVMSATFVDPAGFVLRTGDGSWCRVEATTRATVQCGARSIWDEVEAAASRWAQLGRPTRGRYGITATSSGERQVWLDEPDNVMHG